MRRGVKGEMGVVVRDVVKVQGSEIGTRVVEWCVRLLLY